MRGGHPELSEQAQYHRALIRGGHEGQSQRLRSDNGSRNLSDVGSELRKAGGPQAGKGKDTDSLLELPDRMQLG